MAAVEWETIPLADVLERVSRPVRLEPDSEYTPLGVRWYSDGVFRKEKQFGSKIAAKTLYRVEPGDVVYSRLFAWKGSFGVVGEEHTDGVVSNEFPTYRASSDLLPEFFAVWASQPRIWALAEVMSSGTTANSRFRLSEENFLMLEIDLPSIDEQRRIVDAVSAVENLIGALHDELTQAEAARAAAREHLLESLETVDLGDAIAGIDGGLGAIPKCEDRPPRDGEWGIVKVSAIRPGQFFPEEAKTLPPSVSVTEKVKIREGDVLVTRCSGSTRFVGAACRVPIDPQRLILTDFVMRVRFADDVDPDYMVEALASRSVREQIEGDIERTTTLRSISKTRLRSLDVPCPPLTRQREIASVLNALRAAKDRAGEELQAARQVRTSLVDALVSGEFRLSERAAREGELTPA